MIINEATMENGRFVFGAVWKTSQPNQRLWLGIVLQA
jgi:hypothetical protein